MIQFTNTPSDPKAMMIELSYAFLALMTMSSSIRHLELAFFAESGGRQLNLFDALKLIFSFNTFIGFVLNLLQFDVIHSLVNRWMI